MPSKFRSFLTCQPPSVQVNACSTIGHAMEAAFVVGSSGMKHLPSNCIGQPWKARRVCSLVGFEKAVRNKERAFNPSSQLFPALWVQLISNGEAWNQRDGPGRTSWGFLTA